ncbi:MAG: bifunctional [glutamine synthetase] adenylyltransferase/[glutamine synthetase]-adenylyl-L-tyrosine phosphorylase, partial [Kordiimonadaceae bacterium]|nr:bifunctional [glutamine synthetase] adenylyltransferase/[glutamine synthetase]-adenylyl-L-tyrosine phosphorylase [Kordiimonadaceae bacterium]
RVAKAKLALTTAIADLQGSWDLEKITKTLSDFAETSLNKSVNYLINQAVVSGDLSHVDNNTLPKNVSKNSGYVILAMGKLGGYELNYSSDIDLIVLFDFDIVNYSGRKTAQDFFIKLTQKLVKIMADRTADGYVFRTDLQLRPDPGATPIAVSMEGAEFYYQSIGLNWERAAMIKARPVAGDIIAGQDFLQRIRGFVWRKHLDYAAIDDIHAIKNLIHEHHSHREIMLAGHDVKLGRGGIREIEFYAQIHQLISGGREPGLRIPPTCLALNALCKAGKFTKSENNTLQKAYVFLRTLEHRLQMINDDQTHQIPTADDDILRITKFMGYDTVDDFKKKIMEHLNGVHMLFNNLLRDTNQTTRTDKSLSFPTDKYHPDTIVAIQAAGFKDPQKIYDLIKNWQLGRYRSCRTERARLLLKQLIPDILTAFGDHDNPDAGFVKFDDFLSKLPSGVQLFSFIKAQPWLLELLALITGIAPFLSNQLSRQPLLLDSVLSADLFEQNSSFETLSQSLDEQILTARDFQDVLDIARKWANEGKFQVGLQLLRGTTDVVHFGETLAFIAEISLNAMLNHVKKEFAKKHGVIEKSSLCILAMGKLGGHEFTTTSDVDMILIYDAEDMNALSSGPKQLTVNHYYARLSQNFINSISALTGEGKLYEIDMRLRPSGTAGPLAVSIEGFNDYQTGQAWTWEHMALTRGRVISGSKTLTGKIENGIYDILSHKGRDQDNLLHEVSKMRQKLVDNYTTDNIWAMKHTRGGIVDAEFICQYLLLKHANIKPDILSKNMLNQILELTKARILTEITGQKLYDACHLLQSIQAMLRLCLGSTSKNDERSEALLSSIAELLKCSPDDIEGLIIEKQKFIYDLYVEIIENPALQMLTPEPTPPLDNSRK